MRTNPSRRHFLTALGLTLLGSSCSNRPQCRSCRQERDSQSRETVRDRLWMWAHEAGAYDNSYGLPRNGRITPVEGAHYMGVPNVVLVHYNGRPTPPYNQFAIPFKSLKRVNWSITGSGGATTEQEREKVFGLAAAMPFITGVFLDDFFRIAEAPAPNPNAQPPSQPEPVAALTLQQLSDIRNRLNNVNGRRLDLGVVAYTHQLEARILAHLAMCDVLSLWTWRFEDLEALEENMGKLERLAPGKRIRLGCYMWGFGTGKPIPLSLMEKQCQLGLQWLKNGRIDGMIFCATNICDLGLDAVEWTRQWIAREGGKPV